MPPDRPPSPDDREASTNRGQPRPKTTALPATQIEPYARAEVDSYTTRAQAAAVGGRDAQTGVEADVFSVTVEVGSENRGRVGMASVGASSGDGVHRIHGDVMVARAEASVNNRDGGTGLNIGAMSTAVGVEGTAVYSGSSITGGLSLSIGAEAHIGIRDADRDGSSELCARVDVLFFSLGACLENPF